jgi:hypothetical protein
VNLGFSTSDVRVPKWAFVSRGSIISAVMGALLAGKAAAQGNSSLSESKVENEGQPITAAALLAQNDDLRRQLSIQQESLKTLTTSLAESNAEAELFRRKYSDLELRMEALGLQAASADRSKLEQRLLAAVSDLQLATKERDEYRDQMLRLNESILRYLKTSQGGDPQARMDIEAQLRSTNQLVTISRVTAAEQPSLMDGSILSVKEEWSFVVANVGQMQGVKIGMPMRVMRGDRKIATLRVVDVRQRFCGAVIQELDSQKEKIKVGDRLQVDAQGANISLK